MSLPEPVRISKRRRRLRGSWVGASLVTSMCSAAVFDPAFSGRSKMASASSPTRSPRSTNAASEWNPGDFLQVGAACSFSEAHLFA